MNKKTMSVALGAALFCHAAAAVPPPPTLETPRSQALLYELELGGYFSDNRAQTSPSSEAGIVLLPRINFNLFRQGGRIEAQARGSAEHYRWLDDGSTSDLRVRLALMADAAIVPGFFHWTVQNEADTRASDFRRPESADNLQQVNVFATGPSIRLRPQAAWSGLLEASYINSYAEESSDFDSDRLVASAWLLHSPHERRQFHLGVEGSEVRFKENSPLNPDFDRTDFMGRYRSDFRRLSFELVGGHTRIRFDDGQSLDGPLARAIGTFDLSENHRLVGQFVREYSDVARDLLSEVGRFERPRAIRGGPPVQASQYRLTSLDVSWYGRLDRFDWRLNSYTREFDYPFAPIDVSLSHRANGFLAQAGFALSATQRLRFDTLVERRRFSADGRTDHDFYVGVHFDQQLSERWSLRTGVTRFDPDADEAGARWIEHIASVALVRHGGL
jgi:hypothetical protein